MPPTSSATSGACPNSCSTAHIALSNLFSSAGFASANFKRVRSNVEYPRQGSAAATAPSVRTASSATVCHESPVAMAYVSAIGRITFCSEGAVSCPARICVCTRARARRRRCSCVCAMLSNQSASRSALLVSTARSGARAASARSASARRPRKRCRSDSDSIGRRSATLAVLSTVRSSNARHAPGISPSVAGGFAGGAPGSEAAARAAARPAACRTRRASEPPAAWRSERSSDAPKSSAQSACSSGASWRTPATLRNSPSAASESAVARASKSSSSKRALRLGARSAFDSSSPCFSACSPSSAEAAGPREDASVACAPSPRSTRAVCSSRSSGLPSARAQNTSTSAPLAPRLRKPPQAAASASATPPACGARGARNASTRNTRSTRGCGAFAFGDAHGSNSATSAPQSSPSGTCGAMRQSSASARPPPGGAPRPPAFAAFAAAAAPPPSVELRCVRRCPKNAPMCGPSGEGSAARAGSTSLRLPPPSANATAARAAAASESRRPRVASSVSSSS
mmetsp:Transcript_35655/g.83752  ORF Transcript_35655/g.83752 Transcript_35655/m.83752 type:complete len:514 (-) Transcript_35655:999-2540(-)